MKASMFDEVTKALATSTSRRQALRRIGGILGGTALAGLFPGLALADNSDCAHFCNSVFDPGPDRGKCKSDAAHHTGLCYSCGPASPGGTQPICCPQNPDGTCTSYASATCCSGGKVCQNGTCVTPCTPNGGFCNQNSECCSGECDAYSATCVGTVKLCNGSSAAPCSPLGTPCGDCGIAGNCRRDNSGALYCGNGLLFDGRCTTDCDCPNGYFCYIGGICMALC